MCRLGAALVRTLGANRPARLIIGRDTRESGEWIERELARGATAQGATVTDAGVLPTPGVAFLARALDFDLGVVLSASHNPYTDNGIKVFSGRGEKFGEVEERTVEAMMADTDWRATAGDATTMTTGEFVRPYLDHLHKLLPSAGVLEGAQLAIDMANGATTATAKALFTELGFEVVPLGDRPDGRNINLACGSTHPAQLASEVVAAGCRLGVAFDGDGDRAIFVDHRGHIVDGDAVLLLLGVYYKERRTAAARHASSRP